jgi:hypothetical protein
MYYARRQKAERWADIWKLRGFVQESLLKSESVDRFLRNRQIFFFLSTGRSGTQMLSGLLNRDRSCIVLHEPNFFEDVSVMDASRRDYKVAYKYLNGFRKYEIYRRLNKDKEKVSYGEVTGVLRYLSEPILKVFPQACLFLLVRDGRDVVRSIMGRSKFYSTASKGAWAISPLEDDPYLGTWNEMSRFEKICWAWMDTNRHLMSFIPVDNIVRFESVISDFAYFKNKLLDKLKLSISKEIWESCVSQKSINATKVHYSPHWSKWSNIERSAFERICGETMAKLGYTSF